MRCLLKSLPFVLYCNFAMIAFGETTFVSLKSSEVNMRVGPGKEYPVNWILKKSRLPLMLIAEFGQWRKVRFIDQTEGWIHQNMVSRKNTAIVCREDAFLYKYESDSQPIARIEKNVVVSILKTTKDWVKIEVNKIKGWMKSKDLWGVSVE